MLSIDGSLGEGGGQIFRSALALSMVTRRPVRIERIRAGRAKPGLLPQHLTALQASAAVCNAEVTGATAGSGQVSFRPRAIRGGEHRFAVPGSGSATLVVQTIAYALLRAPEPSVITVEGGTHNPSAPPADFLERCWAPALRAMGAQVEVALERPGFHPKGGGMLTAKIVPSEIGRFEREERGPERARRAVTMLAALNEGIADRELRVARERLSLGKEQMSKQLFDESFGPGNAFLVELEHTTGSSIFSSFGDRGLRAEQVAEQAIGRALAFHESDAAVDEHLADQILLAMAIGKGGLFTTTEPTSHTRTQVDLLRRFLEVDVDTTTRDERTYTIELRGADV